MRRIQHRGRAARAALINHAGYWFRPDTARMLMDVNRGVVIGLVKPVVKLKRLRFQRVGQVSQQCVGAFTVIRRETKAAAIFHFLQMAFKPGKQAIIRLWLETFCDVIRLCCLVRDI